MSEMLSQFYRSGSQQKEVKQANVRIKTGSHGLGLCDNDHMLLNVIFISQFSQIFLIV